ncbi:2-keto-4-pentenoate hydratase [Nocardioides zeae]|uniref:2-keto-4-pentenoate hydratase n=1 Tax=Nocardioides zeae TaxID=1457234 RepID=UPI0030841344
MSARDTAVELVCSRLDEAQRSATPVRPQEDWPQLSLDQAYAAQARLVDRRLQRGEQQVGLKLGFTSEAKMRQMGIDELIIGVLTDGMQVPDGGRVDLGTLVHPRVEPEVAFRFGRDLDLADAALQVADLQGALDGVAAGIEVIDSRYEGFSFDLPRVVADNTSAAAFTTGEWVDPDSVQIGELAVTLSIAGAVAAEGSTAAILGHPLSTLPHLLSLGRKLGLSVPAGSVVLAGAATAAVPLLAGDVVVRVAGLGEAHLTGVDGGEVAS